MEALAKHLREPLFTPEHLRLHENTSFGRPNMTGMNRPSKPRLLEAIFFHLRVVGHHVRLLWNIRNRCTSSNFWFIF